MTTLRCAACHRECEKLFQGYGPTCARKRGIEVPKPPKPPRRSKACKTGKRTKSTKPRFKAARATEFLGQLALALEVSP